MKKLKIKIHHPKTKQEAINNFKEFLLCDMWSKIYPFIKINSEYWQREDYFKSEKDFQEYIESHFKVFEKELRRIK